ncbi:hypothetical protein GCM10009099_43130 [Caenispirillum bisanense]
MPIGMVVRRRGRNRRRRGDGTEAMVAGGAGARVARAAAVAAYFSWLTVAIISSEVLMALEFIS